MKHQPIGLFLIVCAAVMPAHAQLSASATVTASQVNATTYHYDLVLKNTGTTTIGTFWFAWIPGYDFLPSPVSNVKSPASWSDNITHFGASDGYGIQWLASGPSAYLAAGQTLSGFSFETSATPAQVEGDFNAYPGNPVETSEVYSGAPFSDNGYTFVAGNAAVTPVLGASATVTATPLNESTYHYDVVLKNTGTTTAGTFWFGWIPGTDLLPSAPVNVKSPATWSANITHSGGSDGYGIQWVASGPSADLPAGQTLSGFSFEGAITPAQLAGSSGGTPVETSFVYSGAPFSDSGFSFVPTNTNAVSTPSPMGVSPPSGSATTQMFTFTFNDTGGYQNLELVDVLINNVLDGRQACYIAFIPSGASSGTIDLVDNGGDAGGPFSSMSLPGTGSVSNGQCSITGSGSLVSGGGNTLTLMLPITFTPSFAGNKVVYMSAQNGSANSGWSALGTWNIAGAAVTGPSVTGMTPGRSTSATMTYTFTFNDTNGWQDITVADVLVNSAINGIGACYIAFVPTGATSGSVLLVDNAGDAGGPFSGMLLPGSGSVSNGQCTVSANGSMVNGAGNTLMLTLNITFNQSFAGNQVFFAAARSATLNSGWQAIGSVSVP